MRARLGPYEILAPLGAGGMGEVYRARDTRLNRTVAIKILAASALDRPEARTRFEREARAIAALDHPHICALYDIGHDEGVDFLVMQYLEGETLASRLTRGPVAIQDALKNAIEIALAMEAAHRRGITHRDLKPSNIMLTRSGSVLFDFGVAKLLTAPPSGSQPSLNRPADLTRAGAIVGTLRYMAPEVFDQKPADARADIFSFGALAYEMLSGRHAFTGESEARVIASILTDEPPPLSSVQPSVPAGLDAVIRKCLSKDPNTRWQEAGELVRQLRSIADVPQVPARKGAIARSWNTPRVRRTTVAAAIVGLLLAIGVPKLPRGTADFVPPPHLAALPCDGGPDATQALCDGLTEDLIARIGGLTMSHRLQVTPLADVVRRKLASVDDARRAVGATRVLRGAARPEGANARVDYTLIDVQSGSAIDAQSFIVGPSHLFDDQDRIVAWLMRAMSLELTHPEREALVARPTSNAAAEWAYLTGRGYMTVLADGDTSIDAALAAFDTAIKEDAGFADVHAGIGLAWWAKNAATSDPQAILRSRAACEEALRIQPALARGQFCLGLAFQAAKAYPAAADAFETAVELDPAYDDAYVWLGRMREMRSSTDAEKVYLGAVEARPDYWAPHAWLAGFYRRQARYEDAVKAYEEALALVPASRLGRAVIVAPWIYLGRYEQAIFALSESIREEPTREAYVNWGMVLYRQRKFDDAAALIEKARALGPPPDSFTLGNLARAYYWSPKENSRAKADALYEEAIELAHQELDRARLSAPKASLHLALAEYYAKTGRTEAARSQLEQVGLSVTNEERPTEPHQIFSAAMVYSQLGERDTALRWLERAVYWGVPAAELRAWVELDSLRNEPSFQTLLKAR